MRARESEIDMEMEKKRRPNFVSSADGSGKRLMVVYSIGKGQ